MYMTGTPMIIYGTYTYKGYKEVNAIIATMIALVQLMVESLLCSVLCLIYLQQTFGSGKVVSIKTN